MPDNGLTKSGKKTRDKIFQSAAALLKKEGYDKLTIKKICEASGTSNGSFYHFFKSKEELLAHYYNISADKFLEECRHQMEGANLYDQMMICYRWYTAYSTSHGVDFCLNFFNPKNKAINPGNMYNAFYEISRECLHQKQDEIREGYDPDVIAHDLCVLAKGIISDWSNSDGAYDVAESTERIFSIYLSGVINK